MSDEPGSLAGAEGGLRSLRSDVLTMLAARVTVGLVNVGIVALVARALGPAGQGRVAVGLTTLLVAAQVGTFGLNSATTVWASRAEVELRRVVLVVLWWAIIAGTTIGGVVLAFIAGAGLLTSTVGDGVVIAAASPVVLLAGFCQGLLVGRGRAREMNAVETVAGLAAMGLVIAALFVADSGPSVVLAAAVSQFALASTAYLWLLRGSLPRGARIDRALARAMLSFSRWAFLAAVLGLVLIRADLLLVDAILGPENAGHYSVALTLSQAISLLPLVLAINLLPRTVRGGTTERTVAVLRRLAVPYAALCLLLGLLAGPVIRAGFGAEYGPSVELLRLLLPGTFALGGILVLSYQLNADGYPASAVVAWALAVAIDLALNLALLEAHGVAVAAIASTVSYGVLLCAIWRVFTRRRAGRPSRPLQPERAGEAH